MQNSKIFAGECAKVFANNEKKKRYKEIKFVKETWLKNHRNLATEERNEKKGKMSHKMKDVKEKLLISKEK